MKGKKNVKSEKNVNGKKVDKDVRKIKLIIAIVIALLVVWFIIVAPLLKFRSIEKQMKEAAIRYYEVNHNELPTGKKIKTISLQKLYDKDFISEDLKSPYTSKECDSKTSWIKVRKEDNEYKYYVYLKCGFLSSKVDHKGPEITLNGNDIVTITKGEKYKDAGVKSVIDDTDGNIDIKKVIIDTSKVNTNKNGEYKITYKVRDSFGNETIKVRTVKVEQILNKIVEKDTGSANVYKGNNENNYVQLDGIVFKIVGLNDDGSVKVVSQDPISVIDYNSVDEWFDYFYNKLSDAAKDYIVDSKWCNEKVSTPGNYTECNSYSRKRKVGLLSVADINNSKGEDGSYNINYETKTWTSNISSSSKTIAYYEGEGYTNEANDSNLAIYPTLNIKENSYIVSGTGSIDDPYILKGNSQKLKIGDNISNAKIGEYISYSGYNWRVIGKEEDETTKILMDDVVVVNGEYFYTSYTNKSKINYSTTEKKNIGYKLNNELPTYIRTSLFVKEKAEALDYKKSIGYNNKTTSKTYTSKLHLPNMYELFGASITGSYWYLNISSDANEGCIMTYDYKVYCGKHNPDSESGIRLAGYLDKKIVVKSGKGTKNNPYTITK